MEAEKWNLANARRPHNFHMQMHILCVHVEEALHVQVPSRQISASESNCRTASRNFIQQLSSQQWCIYIPCGGGGRLKGIVVLIICLLYINKVNNINIITMSQKCAKASKLLVSSSVAAYLNISGGIDYNNIIYANIQISNCGALCFDSRQKYMQSSQPHPSRRGLSSVTAL